MRVREWESVVTKNEKTENEDSMISRDDRTPGLVEKVLFLSRTEARGNSKKILRKTKKWTFLSAFFARKTEHR